MFKSIGKYKITEDIHDISRWLHNRRTSIERSTILKLFKDYVDEEVGKKLTWSNKYSPFTRAVETRCEDDEVIHNLFEVFDYYAKYLINSIWCDLGLNEYSFVLTEVSSSSSGVFLIVENSGDYRIVEHELRERGAL